MPDKESIKKPTLCSVVKDTNPKDAIGIRKVPFSTLPWPVLAELGVGMLEGACKYGRHNYRAIGVRASVYFDATLRHLASWWEGEDIDPDSGLSHVSKAIASLIVLRDAMIRDKCVDDRPPVTKDFIVPLNKVAEEILNKYPNPKQAYLAADGEDQKYGKA
jgi:hypothetical protein